MSFLDDVRTLLADDAALVTLATGGIITVDDVGRLGLNRTSYPAGFDAKQRVKPLIFLKLRDAIPDYQAADDGLQAVSASQVLECWLYQDIGHTTIDGMERRIRSVLHARHLPTGDGGRYLLHWAGNVRPPGFRDTDLDATVQRCDYRARFISKPEA